MAETAVTSNLGWDNFFSTTTTGALTATTTTIPLATPPTPTEGFLVLDPGGANEIIFYNSVSGNNVIVPTTDDRGRGDSTAQAHSSGITVKMNTVGMMFEALQSGLGLSATFTAPAGTISSESLKATVAFRGTTTQTIPDSAAASTVTTYTEVFDYGSDFVHTTGIFTAPYDGVYCLVGNAQFGNIGSSTIRMSCNIVASNGDLAVAWASPQVDTHDPGANATLITKLTAGQTAYMTVMQDFAATAMTSTSFFAGYMVARV